MTTEAQILVTPKEMIDFKSVYDAGHYRHQRFGQAFCNHFNFTCSELFYVTSRKDAEEYIWLFLVS